MTLVVARLQSIPGIGRITAFALRYKIDVIERFADAGHVSSYFGFGVREWQSGDSQVKGKIAKGGDMLIRSLLAQAGRAVSPLPPARPAAALHPSPRAAGPSRESSSRQQSCDRGRAQEPDLRVPPLEARNDLRPPGLPGHARAGDAALESGARPRSIRCAIILAG
jgi:hypothetical protein